MGKHDTLESILGLGTGMSQYLTFTLGPEEYGIEILKVQEIKGLTAITPMPNTPTYVKGVMNLRGTIIPVIDLRGKFGFPEVASHKNSVIVIVTVSTKVMGLVVDTVSDVLHIPANEIQKPMEFGDDSRAHVVNGLVKSGEKVVLLLDIDKLLSGGEIPTVAASV